MARPRHTCMSISPAESLLSDGSKSLITVYFLPVLVLRINCFQTAFNGLHQSINNLHIDTLLHKPPAVGRPIFLARRNEVEPLHKRGYEFRHLEQRDVLADARPRARSELFDKISSLYSTSGECDTYRKQIVLHRAQLCRIDQPAFRPELLNVFAPDGFIVVDHPGVDADYGLEVGAVSVSQAVDSQVCDRMTYAWWEESARQICSAFRDDPGKNLTHGRMQAQGFFDGGLQIRKLLPFLERQWA
jgi:hypothetical protein